MNEADGLCDRLSILEGGRVAALGTPEQLKAQVPPSNGKATTLEDVFLRLSGKKFEEVDLGAA